MVLQAPGPSPGAHLLHPGCYHSYSDAPDTPTTTATSQEQAERRPAGKHDYSGCLTTPRVLTLEAGRLHQAPAPEVAALRGEGTREFNLKLPQEQAVPLLQVGGVTAVAVQAGHWCCCRPGTDVPLGVMAFDRACMPPSTQYSALLMLCQAR